MDLRKLEKAVTLLESQGMIVIEADQQPLYEARKNLGTQFVSIISKYYRQIARGVSNCGRTEEQLQVTVKGVCGNSTDGNGNKTLLYDTWTLYGDKNTQNTDNFVIVYQGPRGETKQFNDMAGMESYIRSLRRE